MKYSLAYIPQSKYKRHHSKEKARLFFKIETNVR